PSSIFLWIIPTRKSVLKQVKFTKINKNQEQETPTQTRAKTARDVVSNVSRLFIEDLVGFS
ncbi:MAG: hypothetical protein ACKPBT_18230, partial [Microcystis aeruginosa]